jgi:hypothetical protein
MDATKFALVEPRATTAIAAIDLYHTDHLAAQISIAIRALHSFRPTNDLAFSPKNI